MSDLRPKGVSISIGGQKRDLLFTVEMIDELQTRCNMPMIDIMGHIAGAADWKTDKETFDVFKKVVVTVAKDEVVTEENLFKILTWEEYGETARKLLEAYGISVPDPDENDEFEDDEDYEDPKVETEQ
jgi:hypothetical protein